MIELCCLVGERTKSRIVSLGIEGESLSNKKKWSGSKEKTNVIPRKKFEELCKVLRVT